MTVAGSHRIDRAEIRDGLQATVLVGVVAAVGLGALGLGAEVAGVDVVGVLGLALWLPSLLAQDFCRSTAFRMQRPDRALASDGVFALFQAVLTVGMLSGGVRGTVAFLAAWGVGATAGAVLGMYQLRVGLHGRGGGARLRLLWPRSRWFLAEFGTAFPADQGYALLLPAILGTAQFGLFRAAASLVGPVFVVFLAGGNVGLPECVRRLRVDGLGGLAEYVPKLTGIVLGVTLLYCGGVALFAEPLLRLVYGDEFVAATTVVYLVAVQYALLAVGFGWGVAMKAAGQMRQLWAMRAVSAIVSITGVALLANALGLFGAGVTCILAGASYAVGTGIGYRQMLLVAGGRRRRGGVHRLGSARARQPLSSPESR